MPNTWDVPVILTGGGRSPVMPGRHAEPTICAAGRGGPPTRTHDGRPHGAVDTVDAVGGVDMLGGVDVLDGVMPASQAHRRHRRHDVADQRATPPADVPAEKGSQTTEYALLLIVAATITMLALTWAKQGAIKNVLDGVIGQILALFGIGAG
jgi:hypothetical protein